MRTLKGLSLRIDGEYNDTFLYGDKLYLITDEELKVVNFHRLISDISPKDPDQRVLFRYMFLYNNFFYKADTDFYEFFNMSSVKRIIKSALDKIGNKAIHNQDLENNIDGIYKHSHPGITHFEIYKNTIFLSNEHGTFCYKIIPNKKLVRKLQIFEYPSVHISAVVGNTVFFSCANNGVYIIEFDNIKDRSKTLSVTAVGKVDIPGISIDLAYQDLVIRDIGNNYHYGFNTLWGKDSDRTEYSPDQRVSSYETINGGDVFFKSNFISSNANRLIEISEDNIAMMKMNYSERMANFQDKQFFYSESASWKNNFQMLQGDIYSGYQTVFGLALDTNYGTIILDDNIANSTTLDSYVISEGENLKIRHFYRSVNYSHIMISIKNDCIEIYSDLTDYFFPKEKKQMRKGITRKQAMAADLWG